MCIFLDKTTLYVDCPVGESDGVGFKSTRGLSTHFKQVHPEVPKKYVSEPNGLESSGNKRSFDFPYCEVECIAQNDSNKHYKSAYALTKKTVAEDDEKRGVESKIKYPTESKSIDHNRKQNEDADDIYTATYNKKNRELFDLCKSVVPSIKDSRDEGKKMNEIIEAIREKLCESNIDCAFIKWSKPQGAGSSYEKLKVLII